MGLHMRPEVFIHGLELATNNPQLRWRRFIDEQIALIRKCLFREAAEFAAHVAPLKLQSFFS